MIPSADGNARSSTFVLALSPVKASTEKPFADASAMRETTTAPREGTVPAARTTPEGARAAAMGPAMTAASGPGIADPSDTAPASLEDPARLWQPTATSRIRTANRRACTGATVAAGWPEGYPPRMSRAPQELPKRGARKARLASRGAQVVFVAAEDGLRQGGSHDAFRRFPARPSERSLDLTRIDRRASGAHVARPIKHVAELA